MKIYFTASPRGKVYYSDFYKRIFHEIETLNHKNLEDLPVTSNERFYLGDDKSRKELYRKTIDNISKADVLVLEVSHHSFAVGYIADRALQLGKPVIALYTEGSDPYFASGIMSERLQVLEYNQDNLEDVLATALEHAEETLNTEFIVSLPTSMHQYLDEKAKAENSTRTQYLLELIRKDIESKK
jgi:hypothetical protein